MAALRTSLHLSLTRCGFRSLPLAGKGSVDLVIIIYLSVGGNRYISSYEDTRPNLMLNENTRVICQGLTGKQVIINPL